MATFSQTLETSEPAAQRVDWNSLLAYTGLALTVLLSRLPFIAAGYGLDPDALRVVNNGVLIRSTGVYSSSRHPGYPVHEYLVAWLIPGGEWAINAATAVMSSIAAVAFAICLRELGVRAALLFALALAAVPVVYINSSCAMDYVWALGFIMLAACLTLRRRMWLAGVLLGLAVGTRITSGAMLVPLTFLTLSWASGRAAVKAISRLWFATLLVSGVCYAPAFQHYGVKFFSFAEALGGGSAEAIFRRATIGVWGSTGRLTLAAALVYAAATGWTLRNEGRAKARRWASAACLAAIALYTVAYQKLPHEAGYLIPLVPFSIWLVALWITTPAAVVFSALLCASPFVDYREGELPTLVGPVIADHRERLAVESLIQKIVDAAARLQEPAVLVAGYRLPAIEAKLGGQKTERQRWLYSIKNNEQLAGFRSQGFKVYFVDRATENYQKRINGLKLRQLGAKPLPLDP